MNPYPSRYFRGQRNSKEYLIGSEWLTVGELCDRYNLKKVTIKKRLERGTPMHAPVDNRSTPSRVFLL